MNTYLSYLINQVDINDILTNITLWTAILEIVLFIFLGFFLSRIKIFPKNIDEYLLKVVLTLSIPCLAFTSFLGDVDKESLKGLGFTFIYGMIIYTIYFFISKLIFSYIKDKSKRNVLEILTVFGSATFVAQPIIMKCFPDALKDSVMFTMPFRLYVYTYVFFTILNLSKSNKNNNKDNDNKTSKALSVIKKIFTNPIIVATFLGLIIYLLSFIGDNKDLNNWWIIENKGLIGPFFNIRISFPPLYNAMKTLSSMSLPLALISIGAILGRTSIKDSLTNKKVWLSSLLKVIATSSINFLILYLLNFIPNFKVPFNTVLATTLMWESPTSTVVLTYCASYKVEEEMAASIYFVSTIISLILLPFYLIFFFYLKSSNIFY
ncbi:MAG: AEC family transporter [Bacillales bacterium]